MLLLNFLQIILVFRNQFRVLEEVINFSSPLSPKDDSEGFDVLIGKLILTSNYGFDDPRSQL